VILNFRSMGLETNETGCMSVLFLWLSSPESPSSQVTPPGSDSQGAAAQLGKRENPTTTGACYSYSRRYRRASERVQPV
jgi:hypothetical protein